MSITIQNLRFSPYTQKNAYKAIFGDVLTFTFTLPDVFQEGDTYMLALDYERKMYPIGRPVCGYSETYTRDGNNITMGLLLNTQRFGEYVSTLKKPMPVWLQLVRVRGGVYDTILLDDILAVPSVIDGANTVYPGDPITDYVERAETAAENAERDAGTASAAATDAQRYAQAASDAAGVATAAIDGIQGYITLATELNDALERYNGDNDEY